LNVPVTVSPPPAADPVFELVATVDITKLPLTAEEGFVLSRMMNRRVTIRDLERETGMPPPTLKGHLESMMKKGAVTMQRASAQAPVATAAKPKDPYQGIIFSPADMADGRELTEEQKKRILFVEMHLDEWSHYRLLELKRTAPPAEVKTAYFRLSKEFHPDTFFRKDVGRYRERVDRIFRAMKAAYDVLSKPATRAAYDDTLVGELTDEDIEELARIADVKRREEERVARLARNEATRKARRLKWNPVSQRLARARELYKLAEEARKAGKPEEAATHARLACTFDEALVVRAEPIIAEAEAARCASLLKKVQSALQYGDKSMEADIKKAAEEAAQKAEGLKRPALLIEVGRVLLQVHLPQRAFRLAQLATEVDDRLVAGWRLAADAAAREEKWALAGRAAERWLALEPASEAAKQAVKQAKSKGGGKV
jgi:curved DNA-binding protein CbpA